MAMKISDDENTSRRSFIKNGVAVGLGLTLNGINVPAATKQETIVESSDLSERAKKLMALFGLKYPIFQAAPGGEALALSVAKAGAMGALSLTSAAPDEAFQTVTCMKAATMGNFYGNFILHFEPKSLDKALEAGIPAVQFSWGIPTKTIISKIRAAKVKLGIQVASKDNAKAALDLQPDFLICQGVEAGGHVQANEPLLQSLREILPEAKDVPVLAAGGLATGHHIRKVLNAGASGAVMGSRLIATKESDIHTEYKNALVEAKENSTVFTTCFDEGWFALHRVLKNKTFLRWQAAGCPLAGKRPGENDVVATRADGSAIKRYSTMPPLQSLQGNLSELAMYAGEGVKNIHDIPSAGDLLLRLWKEYENKR